MISDKPLSVELVDYMGSDLSVVNAARVSFNKHHSELDESDERLIHFLAKHNHWTPFGHCSVSFRVKTPIFVARQLGKHQVGLVWNEISRRYVDEPPQFFSPKHWRERNENKKQGSYDDRFIEKVSGVSLKWIYELYCKFGFMLYNHMIRDNVCPEQARMILPQSMITEWIWTGSLMAFARVCKLRLKADTQMETRIIAEQINIVMTQLFPLSWEALNMVRHDEKVNS